MCTGGCKGTKATTNPSAKNSRGVYNPKPISRGSGAFGTPQVKIKFGGKK